MGSLILWGNICVEYAGMFLLPAHGGQGEGSFLLFNELSPFNNHISLLLIIF